MYQKEIRHWFWKYKVYADAEEGIVRLDFAGKVREWHISALSNVTYSTIARVVDHGTATENILRGAAIGGRMGAFLGAFEPTGTTGILKCLEFLVCYRVKAQRYFFGDYFLESYAPGTQERIKLPSSQRMLKYVQIATRGIDDEIKKWYDDNEGWRYPIPGEEEE